MVSELFTMRISLNSFTCVMCMGSMSLEKQIWNRMVCALFYLRVCHLGPLHRLIGW